MKRPGIFKKLPADPDHEPDLYRISEISPVPLKAEDEDMILLYSTLQGGPKTRMPICSTLFLASNNVASDVKTVSVEESVEESRANSANPHASQWTPQEQEAFPSFGQRTNLFNSPDYIPFLASTSAIGAMPTVQLPQNSVAVSNQVSTLMAANNLAFDPFAMQQTQFAAGFAAAAAMMQSLQQAANFAQQGETKKDKN